jgi:hypothetical protein
MRTTTRRARVAAALGLLVLAVACGGGSGGEPAAIPEGQDPGLVHVHGLALDPASEDAMYVATHTGLFHVEGDEIARVGTATHDLMGFTVAGPGDFLASGHPDLRVERLQVPGKPPLLGLVKSDDAQRWESVSLLGEVDFHSLEAAHDLVYGLDSTSGRFLVSADRQEWETRSEIQLIDFAVSPDDPELIVGSGQAGLVRSSDGGRTWDELDSDPYVFLSWADSGLYAVTPDGQVAVSSDDGETFATRGSVNGQPEALLATGDRVLAAVSGVGIVESRDAGETFEVLVGGGAASADAHNG